MRLGHLMVVALSTGAAAYGCGSAAPSAEQSQAGAAASSGSAGGAAGTRSQQAGSAGNGAAGVRSQAGTVAASGGRAAAGSPAADAGASDAATAAPDASMTDGVAGAGGAQAPDAGPDAALPAGNCDRCQTYAAPLQSGKVEPAELDALSGLAQSRAQAEILFAHNDHDRPVVYALDLQGRLHARITLEGADVTDVEDIAVGPCGAQTCVYLADIGDNAAQRAEYGVVRFVQPTVPDAPGSVELKPPFEHFRFEYEDGSHNAESLMVAPNGALYVVTKLAPGSGGKVTATGPSSVYRLEASALSAGKVARATKVSTLTVPARGEFALSAAAAHPCGAGFVLRTYDRLYEYVAPSGAGFEAAFMDSPTSVAMPEEPQSEGIDYRHGGRGFISSGEGKQAPIFTIGCTP